MVENLLFDAGEYLTLLESADLETHEPFPTVLEFVSKAKDGFYDPARTIKDRDRLAVETIETLLNVLGRIDNPSSVDNYEAFKQDLGRLDPLTKSFLRAASFKAETEAIKHLAPGEYSGSSLLRSQLMSLLV
ncbi:MAG: hypothetical protein UX13_C0037G0005 [Candidatus Woesebacteria bacterium GW2011_GWB1_45_5]|uniref:Uncharacterized protein n=1 Tax=Candidatus Woesebacteria bacterium GW2011_GWB1_45_5 TaxID=1618581 RepID=A0A0G1MMI4_9BACT|nr:MAG: hypothetical protein UX13_C0037G0005 [Candidatus Woesebacteria bacterium GW2011_GWB1_45_5]